MGVLLQLGRGELLRAKRERSWLLSFLTSSLCPRSAKAAVAVLLPLPLLQLLLAARPTLAVAGTARRCGALGAALGAASARSVEDYLLRSKNLAEKATKTLGPAPSGRAPGPSAGSAARAESRVLSSVAIRGPRGLGRLVEILGISENLYQ